MLANSVQLQFVPLQSILSYCDHPNQSQVRSLAMSAFTSRPCSVVDRIRPRGEIMLKLNKPGRVLTSQAFCPPYIPAPLKTHPDTIVDTWSDHSERSNTLFCSAPHP